MITNDPYGISRAVRVWDSLDAGKGRPGRKRKFDQKEIDMCLNCTAAHCSGNCRGKPPVKRKVPGDPCLTCYSASVCRENGYICNEKARWKPKNAWRQISFDEAEARRMFYAGCSYREIGDALGVKRETIRKWAARRGIRKDYVKNRGVKESEHEPAN